MELDKTKIFIYRFLFLLFFLSFINGYAQISEYHIKAVYLQKFTRFIEWPDTSEMKDTSKPFRITVLGAHAFNGILDDIYKNNKIHGKRVEINYIQKIEDLQPCQILFISASKKNRIKSILEKAHERDMLTVSDTPGFGEAGVLINFYIKNDKVLFEINYDAVRKSKIRISYLLLELAKIIGRNDDVLQ